MRDPGHALTQWWALVKPGGYLITVVPDENLYEQGIWPSAFNPDHKFAFTLGPTDSTKPHLLNLSDLHQQLPRALIIEATRQDFRYRYDILNLSLRRRNIANMVRYQKALTWMRRARLGRLAPERRLWRLVAAFGVPVDQTLGPALAQLQVVTRKQETTQYICFGRHHAK